MPTGAGLRRANVQLCPPGDVPVRPDGLLLAPGASTKEPALVTGQNPGWAFVCFDNDYNSHLVMDASNFKRGACQCVYRTKQLRVQHRETRELGLADAETLLHLFQVAGEL